MHFHHRKPFAADRVRCFLQYLAERKSPVCFSGLPPNLYSASERLVKANTSLRIGFSEDVLQGRDLTMQVQPESTGHVLSLDFGLCAGLTSFLTSHMVLEMLVTGARMLSSDYAVLAIVSRPEGAATAGLEAGSQPIAIWTAAHVSLPMKPVGGRALENLKLIQRQWDGACLWLCSQPPITFDQWKTLAQLVSDENVDRPLLLGAVADGLCATDWKVRACAMIWAARHGLSELGPAIKATAIPEADVPGVTSEARHMLLAMRKACLILLSGMPPPPLEAVACDSRAGMQAHLLRLMAGKPSGFRDKFSELIDSLIQPASEQ